MTVRLRGAGDRPDATHRRTPRSVGRRAVTVAAIVMLGASCADGSPAALRPRATGEPTAEPTTTPVAISVAGPVGGPEGITAPPPFRLRYPGHELRLHPYTYCYDNGCVDGAPGQDLPNVGSPSEIHVHVPLAGAELTATFTPAGERCGPQQTVHPSPEGEGWYRLRPAGHTDRYDVNLFAQGGGDMAATFEWTTSADGPLATPTGRLAIIAEHDGQPDSYGVELALDGLAGTPRSAKAHITVTASNGRSVDFDAARADDRPCQSEGSVYFDGPDAPGKAAAALGPGPFRYQVSLVLDDSSYDASARYPDDVISGNEPSVVLTFTPDLPGPR